MKEPPLKNTKTVAFRFSGEERSLEKVETIFKNLLEISQRDIYGGGFEGCNSVYVKFSNETIYKQTAALHGNTYDYDGTTNLQIIVVSTYKIKVYLKNVPFQLSNNAIESIFMKSDLSAYIC